MCGIASWRCVCLLHPIGKWALLHRTCDLLVNTYSSIFSLLSIGRYLSLVFIRHEKR